jgi:Spy/CpxP family protein refolding chaperone
MKSLCPSKLILTSLFLIFSFSVVSAQPPDALQEEANFPSAGRPPRPNLLQELDLTKNQIQQIRRLNQERKFVMQDSQRRLREANRALDEAIYSDSDDETEIQMRLREVQAAHTELIKNRTITERAVRRILTPEQLSKFRNLRSEFMQTNGRGNFINNRRDRLRSLPKGMRQRRFGNRQNPPRVQ